MNITRGIIDCDECTHYPTLCQMV